MPDVDGIELLRHIRSDAAYKHVPVVSESLPDPLLCLRIAMETEGP